jgi:hypothetical protein
MKKLFLSFSLLLTLGLTSAVAQDYVGTYSGTLTFTPITSVIDLSGLNLEIENQTLQVNADELLFPDVPVFQTSVPVSIGYPNVSFAPNGNITASPVDVNLIIEVRFSIVSGNVSNNMINLTFRMVDNMTNGFLLKVDATYTGTKQNPSAIKDVFPVEKTIVGYYSILGKKLPKEPTGGMYIILYNDGSAKKVVVN